MNKSYCPKCNSEDVTSITDKNKTIFVCGSCGHKFIRKRIFISYGRDEYTCFAENLKHQLIRQNCEVWFDQDKIREGVASKNPDWYFPELAGIDVTCFEKSDIIKTLLNELKEKSDEIIKNIEGFHVYKHRIELSKLYFDVEDINSIKISKVDSFHILILLDCYFKYLNKGQDDKANLFFKRAVYYLQEFNKNGDALFTQLFSEIYFNENISLARKLIIENIKESDINCVMLLLQYLINDAQNYLKYFITELIAKDSSWKVDVVLCGLIETGFIKMSEEIVAELKDGSLKGRLLGYIVYHYINNNEKAIVKKYLNSVKKDGENDEWLQMAAILFARKNDFNMVDDCLKQMYYINNKAITLCMVAEEQNELKTLNKYQLEAYNISLDLKKDVETKDLVLKYIFAQEHTPLNILLDVFENLIKENLLDKQDKQFLEVILDRLISANDLHSIETLYNRYSKFFREAGGVGLLYKQGYTINEANQINPIRKHYEIFRSLESLENDLYDFTAENINNKETLIDIAFRYAAYTSLIRKGDKNKRIEILKELNEVIDVDDWRRKVKK